MQLRQSMPIRPENRDRYPANWEDIRQAILKREGNCCKWCRVPNGVSHPRTGSKVVLTIAHVHDPDPENVDPDNLAALCQSCHLNHDRPYHVAMRSFNQRQQAMEAGQLPMFEVDTEAEYEHIRGLLKHEGHGATGTA